MSRMSAGAICSRPSGRQEAVSCACSCIAGGAVSDRVTDAVTHGRLLNQTRRTAATSRLPSFSGQLH